MPHQDPAKQHLQAMLGSPYFQAMHRALTYRREELLAEECATEVSIYKNRGALEEVTRWLRHPELVLAYAEHQRADEKRGADAGAVRGADPYLERLQKIVATATDVE